MYFPFLKGTHSSREGRPPGEGGDPDMVPRAWLGLQGGKPQKMATFRITVSVDSDPTRIQSAI